MNNLFCLSKSYDTTILCAGPVDTDNVDFLLYTYYVFRGILEQEYDEKSYNYSFSTRLTRKLPNFPLNR